MNEEQDGADISNQQEEVVLETAEVVEEQGDDSQDEIQAELKKAQELAENYKIRAEKAERLAKAARTTQPEAKQEAKQGDLNSKDLYALMEAKVPQDDIDEVAEYARFKGISIADALKSTVVKTLLGEKAEQRQSAEAANVGSSKRSSGKTSDDVLVAKAEKGELPEDEADMIRLIRSRKGLK